VGKSRYSSWGKFTGFRLVCAVGIAVSAERIDLETHFLWENVCVQRISRWDDYREVGFVSGYPWNPRNTKQS
jgi:hypothetical protein